MKNTNMQIIDYEQFSIIGLHSVTIIKAELFERARKPAYKLWIDFGPAIGILQTSAQVTHLYTLASLINKQVVGCTNLPSKNIAGFSSKCLLVGFANNDGHIVLISPDQAVPNGQKLC